MHWLVDNLAFEYNVDPFWCDRFAAEKKLLQQYPNLCSKRHNYNIK